MRGLQKKCAIVTGGSSGIGKAIALRLAQEGVRVGIFDIDNDGAQETAETANQNANGAPTASFSVDIRDYDAVLAATDQFEAVAGRIDILVNAAGWDEARPFLETQPESWGKIIDINLYGPPKSASRRRIQNGPPKIWSCGEYFV